MARIEVFQPGGIQPDAPTVTPFRAPDFGPGIGPGIAELGKGIGEAAQKVDEIQDVSARIEANRLSVAYNNLATTISQRVRSALGEGAPAAADQGIADLQKGAGDILSKASPRARRMLETEFASRTDQYRSQWWEHGFEQNKQAFDTSSQAANDKDLEAALEQSSDKDAQPYLDSIKSRNSQRSRFFGLGKEWEDGENRKAVSSYYKSRALTIGVNSATDAVNYAMQHREEMSDSDFSAIVRTYRDEALDERAEVEVLGYGRDDAPTVTHDDGTTHKGADPGLVFKGLIIPNEGSALKIDNNGHPVKLGINQGANPDVDVSRLTPASAQKLFVDRYWKPVGADKMAPAMAVVAADTAYVAGVNKAKALVRQSGGDVQKLIELRNDFLAGLHASNPAKYPDYTKRNERVEQYAASLGGDGTPFSFSGRITDKTSMSAVEDEIMARKDLPLALKTRMLRVARERRELLRADKRADEEDARDSLITATTNLGDNFTSVKQLPQDALSRASPETIHSLTDLAKNNRDRKNDEALRPYVMETEITNPAKFASKEFLTELMRKGASHSLISDVQTQQMDIAKKQLNARPDVIGSGQLWTLAKPAFEASGLDFDHDSTKGLSRDAIAKQRQARASQKQQALAFLHDQATEWATAHPGEKPTEQIMKGWIGTALMRTKAGTPVFEANNNAIFNSIPEANRNAIIRALRRNGDTATGKELIDHVVAYLWEYSAIHGGAR
jgi:lysozyme family protein